LKAQSSQTDPAGAPDSDGPAAPEPSAIVCPVCGAPAVQEKCKVICKSEICRGRVVMNCAEF
jgi:hypothetical protein